MSDRVERVAKAIYEAQIADGAPHWPYDRLAFRRLAKAAIAAMSELPDQGADTDLDSDGNLGSDPTINWNK